MPVNVCPWGKGVFWFRRVLFWLYFVLYLKSQRWGRNENKKQIPTGCWAAARVGAYPYKFITTVILNLTLGMSLTRVKNIGTLQSHFMCTRLLMGHVASARTPGIGEGRGQGPPYSHQLRVQVKPWWVWCGVGRSWLSSLHSEGMVGLLACQPGGFWQVPAGSGGGLLLGCAACLAES